ncbi:MAG: SHOCT domain-containing protein [Saprospiraceae bacterium]|nr:SHOCT domain-containing protein [Saprospiraceae bacterium]
MEAPRSRTIPVSTPIKEDPPNKKEAEALDLDGDLLTQIVRLGELRDKGILTEEEFKVQKEKILAEK